MHLDEAALFSATGVKCGCWLSGMEACSVRAWSNSRPKPRFRRTSRKRAPRWRRHRRRSAQRPRRRSRAITTASPGAAAVLSAERDCNFRLTTPDGVVLLKISNRAEDPQAVAAQTDAMIHIADRDPGLPVPRVLTTRDGERVLRWGGPDGTLLVADAQLPAGNTAGPHAADRCPTHKRRHLAGPPGRGAARLRASRQRPAVPMGHHSCG